ncbi:MAG: VWA domain-containing protein [Clostridiales bacterium]|jgi:hypothetical protein|nr:VWA domain-containing protein [Clostridiales bacterium]
MENNKPLSALEKLRAAQKGNSASQGNQASANNKQPKQTSTALASFGVGSKLAELQRSTVPTNVAGVNVEDKIHSKINSEATKKQDDVASKMRAKVELVIVVDRSTSMFSDSSRESVEKEINDGIDYLIDAERGKDTQVSVISFANDSRTHCYRQHVSTLSDINVDLDGGGTALYDTTGDTIKKMEKSLAAEDNNFKTNKVVFAIITDGGRDGEHSNRYTESQIKKLIEAKKLDGWEFILLGAGTTRAKDWAPDLGVDPKMAENYSKKRGGLTENFKAITGVVRQLRLNGTVDASWSDGVRSKMLMLEGGGR